MNSGAATTFAHQPFHFAVFSQNMSALFSGSIFSRSQICSFFPEPWINLPSELHQILKYIPLLSRPHFRWHDNVEFIYNVVWTPPLVDLAPFPSGQFENLRRSADVSGACLVLSVSLHCSHKCAVQWSFSEIHLCAAQCPRGMSSAHCIAFYIRRVQQL